MTMNTNRFYRMPSISVVDIEGADASIIVHNLTTNEVKTLDVDEGRETFVTDVRGKTLGHVCLFRLPDRLRMVGPSNQAAEKSNSQTLRDHVDRYTIREDATPIVVDDEYVAFVVDHQVSKLLGLETGTPTKLKHAAKAIGNLEVEAYGANWLGEGTSILLIDRERADALEQELSQQDLSPGNESEFHHARIEAGFPWYGIDLDQTNLPQEADRDVMAISFTKGCYLGQETVARLDALGQVQKKLVRWKITGTMPKPDATLVSDDKKVGRLTSVTATNEGAMAIGFARRSHFDAGATAQGEDFQGEIL